MRFWGVYSVYFEIGSPSMAFLPNSSGVIAFLYLSTVITVATSVGIQDEPKAEMLRGGMECEEKNEVLSFITRSFTCPEPGDSPDEKFCCGTETNRFCCDNIFGLNEQDMDWIAQNLAEFVAILLVVLVILVVCICLCCCFLPCCLLAKRRQNRGAVHGAPMTVVAQPPPQQQQYYPPQQQQGYAQVPQHGYPQQGYPQPGYPQPPPYSAQQAPPYTANDNLQMTVNPEMQKQAAFNPNYAS